MSFIIAGAGALGRVMYDFISRHYEIVAFADDSSEYENTMICGLKVLKIDQIIDHFNNDVQIILAVLNPLNRKLISKQILNMGFKIATYIADSSFISPFAKIGPSCCLLPNSFVMNNASVGKYVHLHFNSVVGHDCVVGKYSSIAPNVILGGFAKLGKLVSIGMGAKILPHLIVGDGAVVGAGAVVTKSIPSKTIVYGNPATIKKI